MEKPGKVSERVHIDKNEVNPDEVWGDKRKVFEIVGLGSGRGFEIANVNLPRDWEKDIEKLKFLDYQKIETMYSMMCEEYKGYCLDKIKFDPKGVLTEVAVKNENSESIAKLRLNYNGLNWRRQEGIYFSENINDIKSAVLLMEIIGTHFSFVWGDEFDYSYIVPFSNGCMRGYGSAHLRLPKKVYELGEGKKVTNEYYQQSLGRLALNISGRFGLKYDKTDVAFDDNGILLGASVEGDRTNYTIGQFGRDYQPHNVDTAYQAAALHGIVANYINFVNGIHQTEE